MTVPLLERFLAFLDASPTPWHAAAEAASALEQAGFVALDEGGPPQPLAPGQRGFLRRGGTLLAFRMGSSPPAEAGFRIVSAHTDSPNLRLKPRPIERTHGYLRLGVEVYGGVILATWVDRELGLAGQVFVRDGQGQRGHLVDLRRPLCRIPTVAIHLDRRVNEDGLKLNAQTQMAPVLGLEAGPDPDPLRSLLADAVGVGPDDVLTWDLCLRDLVPAATGGLDGEFLFSGRLDNLGSSHAGLEALLQASGDDEPPEQTAVLALFDHEEVGSTSARGATSRLLQGLLERLVRDAEPGAPGGLSRAIAASWHLSADMAHAVHPGWSDKHDKEHMPRLNAGPVIKQNASQRYGTEAETAALLVRIFERDDVPYQWFVNRSDLRCGSTVGPLVAAELGVRTADLGNPMLSMHSVREMAGSHDHAFMVTAMSRFLQGFR